MHKFPSYSEILKLLVQMSIYKIAQILATYVNSDFAYQIVGVVMAPEGTLA